MKRLATKRTTSPLHRGDATRNSTGNAGIAPKKPIVKLSRTASDTRRGQEAEMRTQSRMPQTRALVRPIVTKKDHQRHQQQQQQSNSVSIPLRPLSDVMQKGIQSEKEVDIHKYRYHRAVLSFAHHFITLSTTVSFVDKIIFIFNFRRKIAPLFYHIIIKIYDTNMIKNNYN